jgi:hypothetical protein
MPRQLPGAIDARVRKPQNNNPKSQTNSEPTKSRLQREGVYTSGKAPEPCQNRSSPTKSHQSPPRECRWPQWPRCPASGLFKSALLHLRQARPPNPSTVRWLPPPALFLGLGLDPLRASDGPGLLVSPTRPTLARGRPTPRICASAVHEAGRPPRKQDARPGSRTPARLPRPRALPRWEALAAGEAAAPSCGPCVPAHGPHTCDARGGPTPARPRQGGGPKPFPLPPSRGWASVGRPPGGRQRETPRPGHLGGAQAQGLPPNAPTSPGGPQAPASNSHPDSPLRSS